MILTPCCSCFLTVITARTYPAKQHCLCITPLKKNAAVQRIPMITCWNAYNSCALCCFDDGLDLCESQKQLPALLWSRNAQMPCCSSKRLYGHPPNILRSPALDKLITGPSQNRIPHEIGAYLSILRAPPLILLSTTTETHKQATQMSAEDLTLKWLAASCWRWLLCLLTQSHPTFLHVPAHQRPCCPELRAPCTAGSPA